MGIFSDARLDSSMAFLVGLKHDFYHFLYILSNFVMIISPKRENVLLFLYPQFSNGLSF